MPPDDGARPNGAGQAPDLDSGVGLFSEARGGCWAAITTASCVVVAAWGHLTLMSSDLGRQRGASSATFLEFGAVPVLLIIGSALSAGLIAFCATAPGKSRTKTSEILRSPTKWQAAAVVGVLTGLLLSGLFAIAVLSNDGRSVAWQPIVGTTIAVVAILAFGGFFLASRRARVGIAASFVITFLLLFTYLLTLDSLNSAIADVSAEAARAAAAAGKSPEDVGTAAATAAQQASGASTLQNIIGDFRTYVGWILAAYFASDATIAVAKIAKSGSQQDPTVLGRMDRDLATDQQITRSA